MDGVNKYIFRVYRRVERNRFESLNPSQQQQNVFVLVSDSIFMSTSPSVMRRQLDDELVSTSYLLMISRENDFEENEKLN